MATKKYLIDTNPVIDFLRNKLPINGMNLMNSIIDDFPSISVVTRIELLSFNTIDEHKKTLESFIDDSIVFDLTEEVIQKCIEIRKKYKSKLPDAIIAATALVYNLFLVTRNKSDFKNIEGLELLDLHNQ